MFETLDEDTYFEIQNALENAHEIAGQLASAQVDTELWWVENYDTDCNNHIRVRLACGRYYEPDDYKSIDVSVKDMIRGYNDDEWLETEIKRLRDERLARLERTRKAQEAFRQQALEQKERQEYERLRKKFDPPQGSDQPV